MAYNPKINITSRNKALKTYVWATLTYSGETWTINNETRDRLEAFEMWSLRRMLRVPWTARKTNTQVLQQANTNRELLKQIKKRQLKFLGHSARKHKVELLSITGKIDGKRARGRQRQKYIDRVIINNNLTCRAPELIHMTENRRQWRDMTAQVT